MGKLKKVITKKEQSKIKNLDRNIASVRPASQNSETMTDNLVSQKLLEYILTGDLDSFRKVLASHIMSSNKLQLSNKTGIGRKTLYNIMDSSISFNPALSTVSAIIRGLSE